MLNAQPITFPVVEKFVSVNGEGQHAGMLAAFIRFAGCNLRCTYCDTAWANAKGVAFEQLTLSDVVAFVRKSGVSCVTLTGGEPVLQAGLAELVCALLGLEGPDGAGLWVEVETNGSLDLAPLVSVRESALGASKARGALSLTVDYKLPSSGAQGEMMASNYEALRACDTVKFVCGSKEDLSCALEVCKRYKLPGRIPVYVSPVWGQLHPADIVDFMREHGMYWAHIQLQLHKIIWPNVEKGV